MWVSSNVDVGVVVLCNSGLGSQTRQGRDGIQYYAGLPAEHKRMQCTQVVNGGSKRGT